MFHEGLVLFRLDGEGQRRTIGRRIERQVRADGAFVLCVAAALPAAASPPPNFDAKGAGALSSFLAEAVSRGEVPGVVADTLPLRRS
jgi:hypothetical protein